ncbi:MAG: hypothetical protein KBC48_03195 [Candidatus Pacebacteria bacterium]|nr:hypothetical protein [Candidatus Paceibacterota bacterium]
MIFIIWCCFSVKGPSVTYAGPVEEEHFPAPVVEFVPPVASNSHLPTVHDDGSGSVYLRLSGNGPNPEIYPDDAVSRLMEGKKWWKENHPEKRIFSISLVHDSFYDRTCVVGLLMAYEDK